MREPDNYLTQLEPNQNDPSYADMNSLIEFSQGPHKYLIGKGSLAVRTIFRFGKTTCIGLPKRFFGPRRLACVKSAGLLADGSRAGTLELVHQTIELLEIGHADCSSDCLDRQGSRLKQVLGFIGSTLTDVFRDRHSQ